MEAFGDLIDFSLFLQLHFFLVSVATILMCIWFAVPFVYLADHMDAKNYDKFQQSLAISVLGAANIVGMVMYILIILLKIILHAHLNRVWLWILKSTNIPRN